MTSSNEHKTYPIMTSLVKNPKTKTIFLIQRTTPVAEL